MQKSKSNYKNLSGYSSSYTIFPCVQIPVLSGKYNIEIAVKIQGIGHNTGVSIKCCMN